MSLKDEYLSVSDLVVHKVHCKTWKRDVFMREMSCEDADSLQVENAKSLLNQRARILVRVLCDEKGNRVFTDDDAEALGKKSVKALDELVGHAVKISSIAQDELEDIEKK